MSATRITAREGQLEGAGLTSPSTYLVRLKFGKQHYCVVELKRGEEAEDVAKKLRELAAEVEAPSKSPGDPRS